MFKLQTATSCDCAPTPCTTCCAVGHCSLLCHTITPWCAAPGCVAVALGCTAPQHVTIAPLCWGVLLPVMSPSHCHAGVCCSPLCHAMVCCSPLCCYRTITLGCTAPRHVTIALSCWGALLPVMLPLHHCTEVCCSLLCCHCAIVLGCAAPRCVAISPSCHGVLLPIMLHHCTVTPWCAA